MSSSEHINGETARGDKTAETKVNKTPEEQNKPTYFCVLPGIVTTPPLAEPEIPVEGKTIKVIGAGWGRTGTSSLKAALEILGMKTYHMFDVHHRRDFEFWSRVSDKQAVDWHSVFDHRGYEATCDFPSAGYYKEQMAAYPDAKVILTLRDPEKWYRSCCDTIFPTMAEYPNSSFGFQVGVNAIFGRRRHEMLRKVVARDAFGFDWSKENIIRRYEEHNAEVRRLVPADRLLVIDITEGKGWGPLCDFLGLPVPEATFPRVNDTAEFQSRVQTLAMVGWIGGILLLGVPLAYEAIMLHTAPVA